MSIGCFGDSKEDQWKWNKLHEEKEDLVECEQCGLYDTEPKECWVCGKKLCFECLETVNFDEKIYCNQCMNTKFEQK